MTDRHDEYNGYDRDDEGHRERKREQSRKRPETQRQVIGLEVSQHYSRARNECLCLAWEVVGARYPYREYFVYAESGFAGEKWRNLHEDFGIDATESVEQAVEALDWVSRNGEIPTHIVTAPSNDPKFTDIVRRVWKD